MSTPLQQDIEIEMDRFEQAKAAVIKKYSMMERPQGKLRDKVAVCVDALCTLVIGGCVVVQVKPWSWSWCGAVGKC